MTMLAQVPLFEDLPAHEIDALAATLHRQTYAVGTLLFGEGDNGDRFYIVLDGHIAIIKALGTVDERLLALRGAGEIVGEMSLLNRDGLRTASARVQSAALVLELTPTDFDALLRRYPALAYGMLRMMSDRLRVSHDTSIRELHEKNERLANAYAELQAAQARLIEQETLAHELRLARTLNYRWGEGVAQQRLGEALRGLGDDAQAAELMQRALAIFREIGDRTYQAGALAQLGGLASSRGDYVGARDRLEQALALSRAVQANEPALDALVFLSTLWQQMGDHELALTYAEQAWQIAQGMGSRYRQAQVLVARGRALAGVQRHTDAVAAYQQALTLFTEIGVRAPVTSTARAGLAAIALAQGDL